MYKAFFGLARSPFEISPDPAFFYDTPRHNEALASLYHGVKNRRGFVVVTGEVGTGKTLLLRCLLDRLRSDHLACAVIFNPRLAVMDFLRYIAADLGITAGTKSKSELLMQFNQFLIRRHNRGLTTAVIIDEAQQLSPVLLEEVRLLTNLETSRYKLLQIVLVGQPELDEMLDAPSLRQLKQRIALRCHLLPLNEEETYSYVFRRLSVAGADADAYTIFPRETLARIFQYSQGIPRVVNTLCEQALIAGYARQAKSIPSQVIDEIAADFHLSESPMNGNGTPSPRRSHSTQQRTLNAVRKLLRLLESGREEVLPAQELIAEEPSDSEAGPEPELQMAAAALDDEEVPLTGGRKPWTTIEPNSRRRRAQ